MQGPSAYIPAADGQFRSNWQAQISQYTHTHPGASAVDAAKALSAGGPAIPYAAAPPALPGGWTASSPGSRRHSKEWYMGQKGALADVNQVTAANGNMGMYDGHGSGRHKKANGSWGNGSYANGSYSNGSYSNGNYANGSYANGSTDVKAGAMSPRRTALATNIGYSPAGYQSGGEVQDLIFEICKKEVNPEDETAAGREAFAQKIRGADYEGGHTKVVYLKPTMGQWQEIAKLLSGRENLMVLKRPVQTSAGQFGMDHEFFVINGQREFAPQILVDIIEGKIGTVNPKKIGYLENKTIFVPIKVAHQTSTMYRSPLSVRGAQAASSPYYSASIMPEMRPAGFATPPASPYVVPGTAAASSAYSSPTQLSAGRTISAGMSPRRQSVYFPAAATVGANSGIL